MAKNTSSSTTTTTRRGTTWGYIMNILSYVAVCIGGLALFIAAVLAKCGIEANFIGIMQRIANAIGWLVLCLLSFNYIKRRRKIWMWVVWVIAVVMIVIGIIL